MLLEVLLIIIILLIVFINYDFHQTKLLFFIASYGVNQLDLLYLQIKSFVVICESGFLIKIIIHHTDISNTSSFNHFYCYNRKSFVDIDFIKISPLVKYFLAKEHRKYIVDNLKEIKKYDHIGYFENDMGFTLSNLRYYFFTLSLINKYNIKNAMPGFIRYELSKCSNGDICKTCPEFLSSVNVHVINNKLFINVYVGYSAMWILPIKKIIKYINDKDFVIIPKGDYRASAGIREYYSYFYWVKHYKPFIPLDKIDDCFIHHLSNKYIHSSKIIQVTELYNQMNLCRSKNGLKYLGIKNNRVITINRSIISKKCVKLFSCNNIFR